MVTPLQTIRFCFFNPRTINGKKVIQKGTETTVTFKYNSVSEVKEYDAQPIYRVPPEYPEGCARRARSEEYVILEFDVSAKGTPENIKIIESTRKCFHKSAIAAVEKWKYDPKTVDGLTVVRPNVITRITYLLKKTGTSRSPRDLRSGFVQKIKSVSRLLNANKLDKAEEKLDDITNKYGDDFSPAERALFHQMRGALRLSRKDYTGALDDLRIAQKGRYLDEKTTIAIGEMIDNLEKALGIRPAVK